MNSTVAKQVGAVIDELAKRLQVLAEKVWSVMVKQAHINGVMDICIGLVLYSLITLFAIWFYFCFKNKKFKNDGMEMNEYEFIAGVCFLLVFILLPVGSIFIFEGIKEIYNPEYYAIELIGDMFK